MNTPNMDIIKIPDSVKPSLIDKNRTITIEVLLSEDNKIVGDLTMHLISEGAEVSEASTISRVRYNEVFFGCTYRIDLS